MDDKAKAGVGKVTNLEYSAASDAGTRIELKIPGPPDYVVVVRLAAAAVPRRNGLSYHRTADPTVPGGEACPAAMLPAGPAAVPALNNPRDRQQHPTHPR